jgi:Protein of unknown function (DUF1579)
MMRMERMIVGATCIVGLVVSGAVLAANPTAAPTEPKPAKETGTKAAPAQAPTQQDTMTTWLRAATPGEQHKVLEGFVGRWSSHVKMQMDPAQPIQESNGTAEGAMVLGGRYVQVIHHGTMMGQPFEGIMLSGYDNLAKKYVATWVDNMGTAIVHYDGSFDKNSKRLMMGARYTDPMTGKPTKSRSVTTFVSPTSWTYEEYSPGPGGKERLVMIITFTKQA